MEKAASSSTLLKPLYTYVWDTVKGKNPNDDILCFTNMLRLGFPLQHSPSQTRNAQYIFFIFTIFKHGIETQEEFWSFGAWQLVNFMLKWVAYLSKSSLTSIAMSKKLNSISSDYSKFFVP